LPWPCVPRRSVHTRARKAINKLSRGIVRRGYDDGDRTDEAAEAVKKYLNDSPPTPTAKEEDPEHQKALTRTDGLPERDREFYMREGFEMPRGKHWLYLRHPPPPDVRPNYDQRERREGDPPPLREVFRGDMDTHHQRVFNWGIGNRFRRYNRKHPVHHPHPKEITLRNDYYDSSNPNVTWEDLNEAWEVYWYEHEKLQAKPFPVKKYGVEAAKREAFMFYTQLKQDGRLGSKPHYDSGIDGVTWDEKLSSWVTWYRENGRPCTRAFCAEVHGFDKARELAVDRRRTYLERLSQETGSPQPPPAAEPVPSNALPPGKERLRFVRGGWRGVEGA